MDELDQPAAPLASPSADDLTTTPLIDILAPDPEPPPVSTARRIFFGPYGLRAGWSLLIYLAMVAIVIASVNLVMHRLHPRHKHDTPAAAASTAKAGTPAAAPAATTAKPAAKPDEDKEPESGREFLIVEGLQFAVLLLLSFIMALIERRRLAAYGLGGATPVSRFLVGSVWGILAISTVIFILHAMHLLVFDRRLDFGAAIFGWGFIQLVGFLLVGLGEEYLFRGYIQYTLTRGMIGLGKLISPRHDRSIAFWIAATITSILFFVAHTGNPGETRLGLFQVFLAGMVFVVALWRTGSLWWGIGWHMAWDWGQSFLYGVPDSGGLMQGRLFATHALGNPRLSGGSDGPEGSILCAPILLLTILVLLYTHRSPQPGFELKPAKLPALN